MTIREIQIKKQALLPLHEIGVATQYFPDYTNDQLYVHRLDVVLLSFILRGSCVHQIDQQQYPVRGPSIGITHLGQTHCIFTDARGIDIMNIYLDLERLNLPEIPPALQDFIPLLLPLNSRFVNRFNRVQQLDLPETSPLPAIARWLDVELRNQKPGWEGTAMAYLRIFLTDLCRSANDTGIRPQKNALPGALRLEKVRTHIDKHFRNPLTLEELAKVAGLSRTYLCRAFRTYAEKSVFTYLQERRIQAAMLALRQSNGKVIQIAAECGFNDLSHFNRCFRRFCGRTPQAYRHRK